VFVHKAGSEYDDVPEERYHFPNGPYLKQVQRTLGDWIVYFEPQGSGSRRIGRQAYFAIARVTRLEKDPRSDTKSYALIDDYMEFDRLVPLIGGDGHFEWRLAQPDGSTNAGLRQRAVRSISDAEFDAICRVGLSRSLQDINDAVDGAIANELDEEAAEFERPIVEQLVRRPLRDAAFRRRVLDSYEYTCAFTGLKIVNGAGRAEVDAAHIRPVGDNHRGADSIRNGIALSKTIHWMFDRGIVSVSDSFEILQSPGRMPERLKPLFNESGRIRVPERGTDRPSSQNLSYHRRMFEDEYGRFELL
jgi:putative restriction endonuclease